MKKIYWAFKRTEKRVAYRLISFLIKRYKWHNTVLNTRIPNVSFLKVKSITVVNGYGQEHSYN
jgi:hypothetical protein